MHFGFAEEQTMIRDSVRKYAETELLPNYQRRDRTGEWLTQDFIDKLVATGLLNLRLPPEYGRQGASFVDCGIVCEEIGRGDHQIRYIVSNAIHLGEMASSMAPELREEWIPRIAKGEMMSLAFTEPGGGADAGNIKTKAVRDGDDYLISERRPASPSRAFPRSCSFPPEPADPARAACRSFWRRPICRASGRKISSAWARNSTAAAVSVSTMFACLPAI